MNQAELRTNINIIHLAFCYIDVIIHIDMNNIQNMKERRNWVESLTDEEMMFVKRFVLASGSLKELAGGYGISYPTVRIRLDRLIEKVKVLDSQDITDNFERLCRVLYTEGKIDMGVLKAIMAAHREQMEDDHEKSNHNR